MAVLGITLTIEQLLLGGAIGAAGWILFVVGKINDYQWNPEGKVFRYCRKKEIPMLAMVDPGSGKATLYPGKKKNREDVKFNIPGTTSVYLTPELTGRSEPMMLRKGLRFYIYPSTHPTPMSVTQMKALTQLVGDVREKWPVLNFLQDIEIVTLVNTPRDFLPMECDRIEERFKPEGGDHKPISASVIQEAVIQIQDELSKEPVRYDAPLLIRSALKLVPSAFLAQDLHQFEIIAEKQAAQASMFNPDHKFLMILGFIGLMVLVGGAVAYNMIT